jgi:pimeloyl-ACP methyl ester carboxylesterase
MGRCVSDFMLSCMTITAQDAVSDTLPKELSVDHMADDMLGFLAELCVIRVHIIDHAAGGVAGLAMAPEGARSRRPSSRCEWLEPARFALPALL